MSTKLERLLSGESDEPLAIPRTSHGAIGCMACGKGRREAVEALMYAGTAKSYSCWITRRGCTLAWNPNQASPGGTGGKRRHPRGVENTGIRADKPEAQ